jgi:hypothetical protein
MTAMSLPGVSIPASHVLGRKLDTVPFSVYHVVIILVLGFVGFIEGYDLPLTGSLLVLAKAPLHMTPDAVRALATWPTFLVGAWRTDGSSDPPRVPSQTPSQPRQFGFAGALHIDF